MDENDSKEALVRQIELFRQKPGFSRLDIHHAIRDHFQNDEECETFITTAITRIQAEEQLREYQEFKKDGIEVELIWNAIVDDSVCDACRSRHATAGPWEDTPPPLHEGCRCRLTMRIRR